MKILITGNLGYIGTIATEILKEKYFIIGIDSGLYLNSLLDREIRPNKQLLKDIRDIEEKDLHDVDSVIHLAGLSNDPLGEMEPRLTEEINFEATKRLAKLSKKMGIKRFVYSSSQSMYGISESSEELDENESKKNPITEYAKTKWEAEKFIKSLNDENFITVSFRPSTVFGASPRLRCDIVFNNLLACAYTTGKIEIKSDGSPWRPVIHVRDVVSAFHAGLVAPKKIIGGNAYNIGINNGNYTIKNLAEVVQKLIPNCNVVFTKEHLKDPRSYKVSFKRILNDLSGYYNPEWDLEKGGKELINFFDKIKFQEEDFRGEKTNRIVNLKKIIGKKFNKNLRLINEN
jgi:nucleoside-diphosphate-sugar epimerase